MVTEEGPLFEAHKKLIFKEFAPFFSQKGWTPGGC